MPRSRQPLHAPLAKADAPNRPARSPLPTTRCPLSAVSSAFTIVEGAEGKPRVDWDVATVDGKQMITDVRVEGLSLAETHRQEFTSVISSKGGKVQALIDILKKKVASL